MINLNKEIKCAIIFMYMKKVFSQYKMHNMIIPLNEKYNKTIEIVTP